MNGIINVGTNCGLPLRAAPDPYASVIRILPHGAEVTIAGAQGDWLLVEQDGTRGWAASQYVSLPDGVDGILDKVKSVAKKIVQKVTGSTAKPNATGAAVTMYVNITSGTLNLRSAPSTFASVAGSLRRGEKVSAMSGGTSGWTYVTTDDGRKGYVSTQYLSLTTPAPSTPTDSAETANLPTDTNNEKMTLSERAKKYIKYGAIAAVVGGGLYYIAKSSKTPNRAKALPASRGLSGTPHKRKKGRKRKYSCKSLK